MVLAALEIARLACNEPQNPQRRTQGATHLTHRQEKPYWALGHSPVATIRNQAFYRLPD
jgi:hypothetical protein